MCGSYQLYYNYYSYAVGAGTDEDRSDRSTCGCTI